MNGAFLDFDRLLKLRVATARFGEMDSAKWWNTKDQLGRTGSMALRRGFPRTHHFAQARSVLAVAAQRCREVFHPSGAVSLFILPEDIEAEFDARWERWLDHATEWAAFFEQVESPGTSLTELLQRLKLVTDEDVAQSSRLRRSAEGKAVPLPNSFSGSDNDVALLALGFAKGDVGVLAVPYAQAGVP